MADAPLGTLEQLTAVWNRLTLAKRLLLVIFTAGVLTGLILLVVFMSAPDYQTLYSGLNSEDANHVLTKLKERKIPYQLSDNGSSVKVPSDKITEIRLQMASEGLPQSGRIGFEIFDKTNFGATDFTAQVNYRRALEGELERTIRSLAEVSQVRVHLTLPKDSLFAEKSEPAKASVVIRHKSGRVLAPANTFGITHLVSSAVEGLRPEHVSILDAHGKLLSPAPVMAGTPAGLTQSELALQRQAEKDLTAKIVSILEPVVGAGKVRADVSLLMDFNSSEVTEESVSPNNNAILSQQKNEERLVAPNQGAAAGIPGTRSNQPGAPGAAPSPPPATDLRLKQNEMTNYEVSRKFSRTIIPKGSIKKLSLAVVIDDKLVAKKDSKDKSAKPAALQPLARTAEEMTHLRSLVEGAVGYSQERGDRITVENISFDLPQAPESEASSSFFTQYSEYIRMAIKYGAILLVVFIVYLFMLRPLMKQLTAPMPQPLAPEKLAAPFAETVPPTPQAGEPMMAAAAGEAPPAPAPKIMAAAPIRAEAGPTVEAIEAMLEAELGGGPNTEALRAAAMKKKVFELAKKEPQTTAGLIRTWLEEGNIRP